MRTHPLFPPFPPPSQARLRSVGMMRIDAISPRSMCEIRLPFFPPPFLLPSSSSSPLTQRAAKSQDQERFSCGVFRSLFSSPFPFPPEDARKTILLRCSVRVLGFFEPKNCCASPSFPLYFPLRQQFFGFEAGTRDAGSAEFLLSFSLLFFPYWVEARPMKTAARRQLFFSFSSFFFSYAQPTTKRSKLRAIKRRRISPLTPLFLTPHRGLEAAHLRGRVFFHREAAIRCGHPHFPPPPFCSRCETADRPAVTLAIPVIRFPFSFSFLFFFFPPPRPARNKDPPHPPSPPPFPFLQCTARIADALLPQGMRQGGMPNSLFFFSFLLRGKDHDALLVRYTSASSLGHPMEAQRVHSPFSRSALFSLLSLLLPP